MATPFFVGCGVAAGAMALRGALHLAQHVKVPNMASNMGAAAPNWQAASAAAQKLYVDAASRLKGGSPGGFEKQMTRREAASILGIKCAPRSRRGDVRWSQMALELVPRAPPRESARMLSHTRRWC